MRCHEAESRLTGSRRDISAIGNDPELAQHLKECPRCAEYARAAGLLERALSGLTEDGREYPVPLTQMRNRVEARVARRRRVPVWLRKPALSLAGAVAVGFLIVSLVPFEYGETIGYDIRFGGVSPELVQEEEHICDMLSTLGLDEAGVDMLGCDTTCSLRILDLKSAEEVELVSTALRQANPDRLTVHVTPLRTTGSRTLLNRAQDKIFDQST